MKRTTLLLSTSLLITALHAQWTNDPLVNTTVRDAITASATPMSSEAPNGGTYITWGGMLSVLLVGVFLVPGYYRVVQSARENLKKRWLSPTVESNAPTSAEQ